MTNMKLLVFTFLLIFSSFTFASDSGGPPTKDELYGIWKLKEWPNPSANKVNPWPLPYQWFAIYEDGRILSMMTTEYIDYSYIELDKIFSSLEFPPPTYEYNGQFLFVTDPSIPNYKEIWGVNLFAINVGNFVKKGDLIMSLAGGDDGSPVYYRFARARAMTFNKALKPDS